MKLTASIKNDELIVEQDGGFCRESRDLLKSIGQWYEIEAGDTWHYPFSEGTLDRLIEVAKELSARVSLSPQLEELHQQSKAKIQQEKDLRKNIQKYIDDPTLELGKYRTRTDIPPWRHQQIAYHWGIRCNNLYLAHKPGLGKTREGSDIAAGRIRMGHVRKPQHFWAQEHVDEIVASKKPKTIKGHWAVKGGILIVCPKSVLGTWYEEIWKWQQIRARPLLGDADRKRQQLRQQAWVYIVTYGSLHLVQDCIFDGLIFDEAHSLANEETNMFQYSMHLRKSCKWVVCMSGTPVSNMLPSLWSQYYLLDLGKTLGASFRAYSRLYLDYTPGYKRRMLPKQGAAEIVARRISRITYFLTMTEAFPDKKEKVQQVMEIPMSGEQIRYYKEVRNETVAQIQTGDITTEQAHLKIIKLLQICQGFVIDDEKNTHTFNSHKLQALQGMLTGEGDLVDERVIVWCQFRHDMQQIVQMLKKKQIATLWYHGQMKDADRERVKHAWNKDHRWKVLVCMIQIGVGLNFHAPKCQDRFGNFHKVHIAVYYGFNHSVTQLEQSMDRIYRGDQTETCLYRYLLSRDFGEYCGEESIVIDKNIYNVLQEKLQQATMIKEESMDYVRRLLGMDDDQEKTAKDAPTAIQSQQ